jgi:disulfide bond formation protein DsbB
MSRSADDLTVRPAPAAGADRWAWAALAVSIAGLAGSLALSWVLQHKPCPLCFYQRTFMMGLVAVLGMGLLAGAARPERVGLLALPLAVAGLGVASFHVWLEVTDKLECPGGMLDLGSAPKQSLATFAVLCVLLLGSVLAGHTPGSGTAAALAGAVVLGALLAAASCTSNPPMPPAPAEPYKKSAPDICRPPFRAPAAP